MNNNEKAENFISFKILQGVQLYYGFSLLTYFNVVMKL